MRRFAREERLRELLADQALVGLSPEGERELETLGTESDAHDSSFELAAAAVHLAFLGDELEPLPGTLRARVSKLLNEG